ncbi:MAG: Hsp20/alpha crystallin family protein [Armatimonadetes bacterium]|nr:Hsp20/alpha crystallin family protein [Armatimonadota bacterium]MBX3109163.1 Hsp20/alpha crystallin family protein [Fimbriimonadaceae bacterium]
MPRRDIEEWILELEPAHIASEVGRTKFARQRGWMPKVDVLESDSHLLIRAELAGVTNEQIQITLNRIRNTLSLRGHRPDDLAAREDTYQAHLLEIEEGAFFREILLPQGDFDFAHMGAKLKNGILAIAIPKSGLDNPVIVVERVTITRI